MRVSVKTWLGNVLVILALASCTKINTTASAYSVGGTLTGLNGALELSLNGNTTMLLSLNGPFTFVAPLAADAGYVVTVTQQPQGQICLVDNDSGTIDANNVTTVDVRCDRTTAAALPGVALRGEVTGLLPSTSVILLNNGNDKILTQNGAFVFSRPMQTGLSYAIDIAAVAPGQACTVANAAGAVPDVDVTDIRVRCTQIPYTLGGTVSGLLPNTQVMLQSGNEIISVSNGAFVFAGRLTTTKPYSVVLMQQPNQQRCAIDNAAGVVASDPVSDIRVVCHPLTYTLGGTLSGLAANSNVMLQNNNDVLTISANGNFTFGLPVGFSYTYNVSVAQNPIAQDCTVTPTYGMMPAANNANLVVTCVRSLKFATNQNADVVVGQPNFLSTASGTSSVNVSVPHGPVLMNAQGQVYFTDSSNFRVIGFDAMPTQNGQSASRVIGQTDPNARVFTADANHFLPYGMARDGNYFMVVDYFDSRVLLYNSFPQNLQAPDVIVGQPDFNTTNSNQCTSVSVSRPQGGTIKNGTLFVADSNNNRVMIWQNLPTVTGASADVVIGQSNFTSCASPNIVGAATLSLPTSTWSNGNMLIVADTLASRLMVWSNTPTQNGQNADFVVGQASFTGRAPGYSLSDPTRGFGLPQWVDSDGVHLFVADTGFQRVLVLDGMPSAQRAPQFLAVLGQSNFASYACNRQSIFPSVPAANTMCLPTAVSLVGNALVVTDVGNNRFLIYNSY